MPTLFDQAIHMNSNMVCAVQIETTGFKPYYHEICEIAIMPLDSFFRPNKKIMPFHFEIAPRHPDRIDKETMTVSDKRMLHYKAYGTDSFKAGDAFGEWFDRIGFLPGKGIIPLAYDWPKIRPFIYNWLGPFNADTSFNYRYRDILSTANFLNDYYDFKINNCPFPKVDFQYICSSVGIPRPKPQEPLTDCKIIGEVYHAMLRDSLLQTQTGDCI
jgi:hypothetical protein